MRHLYRFTIFLVALLSTACSSPETTMPTQQGNPTQVSVRLVKVTTWPLSDAEAQTLSAGQRSELATRGIAMQGTTLVFPDVPLAGYWIEVEGKRVMTNNDAVATLSGPANASAVVYEDHESTHPIASFVLGDLASQPQPATINVRQALRAPTEMNPEDAMIQQIQRGGPPLPFTPIRGPSGKAPPIQSGPPIQPLGTPLPACPKRNITGCAVGANAKPCCVDYNNPLPPGTGEALVRSGTGVGSECSAQAVANFVLSTCFQWTALSVCANEAAFGLGPPCWDHHRYRNCQNLSLTDFSASATGPTMLRPGQTTTLRVRNNLPANDTAVTLLSAASPPGTLAKSGSGLAKLVPGGANAYVIQHYDVGAKKHAEDAELSYTAPAESALPRGCDVVDVIVRFEARVVTNLATVAVPLKIKCMDCPRPCDETKCEKCGLDLTTGKPECLSTCDSRQTCCKGMCANTQTDKKNCGACEKACPEKNECKAGLCKESTPCGEGEPECNGRCCRKEQSCINNFCCSPCAPTETTCAVDSTQFPSYRCGFACCRGATPVCCPIPSGVRCGTAEFGCLGL